MRVSAVGALRRVQCASSLAARALSEAAASSRAAADVADGGTALWRCSVGRVWHTPSSGARVAAPQGSRPASHLQPGAGGHGDSSGGGAHRGHAWAFAAGAGILAGFAAWQSEQCVHAEAEAVPLSKPARMSVGAIDKALASSDAATLIPALGALVLLAEDDNADDAQSLMKQVASKRVLGHADKAVRAAAVAALAALVASDDKAAAAALGGLVKSGAVASCSEVLASQNATPDALVRAASLLAALSAFQGSWASAGAHKSVGYMEAVSEISRLATELSLGTEARLSMVGALGQVLGRKEGGGVASSAAVAAGAIGAMSLILMPFRAEDGALKSAALQVLSAASRQPALLPLVASSPTSEQVLAMASSDLLADAIAALEVTTRVVSSSQWVAERLCIEGNAVQLIVQAAGTFRASKEMREAVASCMEALVATNSDDCRMRVSHFATPVALALARVSDEEMQLRALRMMRTLCLNGFNKFNMQKSFDVIHELVPFLARTDNRQLELVTECLAHLASTDNAMYGENARVLGEARAMKPLMVLARSKHHKTHRNATWALACMTGPCPSLPSFPHPPVHPLS